MFFCIFFFTILFYISNLAFFSKKIYSIFFQIIKRVFLMQRKPSPDQKHPCFCFLIYFLLLFLNFIMIKHPCQTNSSIFFSDIYSKICHLLSKNILFFYSAICSKNSLPFLQIGQTKSSANSSASTI